MTLEQIGQKLKAAREGQGLTYAQIYERTKIPINHLQSIELGITEDLPEPVYVAGFIKRYADLVGLNGQILSEEYRKESGEVRGNGNGNWSGKSSKGNSAQPLVVSAPYVNRTRVVERAGGPNVMTTLFWPAIWVMVVVALIAWLEYHFQTENATKQDPSVLALKEASTKFNQVQATTPTVAPPSSNPTQAANPQQPQPQPPPTEQVTVTASKHVWVEIKSVSTGESLFTGFLEPGDRRDFKDPQGIRIRAGSGGSVSVDSGSGSQALGLPGKPTEKVFMVKNPIQPGNTPVLGADGKPTAGNILGAPTAGAVKPKKVVKRPTTDAHKRLRSIEEAPSRSIPEAGRSIGGDVPYRYTEGRLDTE